MLAVDAGAKAEGRYVADQSTEARSVCTAGVCRYTGVDVMLNASRRAIVFGGVAAASLAGCVMVPVASDGTPIYPMAAPAYPAVAVPVATIQGPGPNYLAPVPGRSAPAAAVPPPPVAAVPAPEIATGSALPAALQARLYPSNEVATETGMLSGTVTNMMTGKGFFQLNYKGEVLSGEATRVPGDQRRGLASAYGQRGTFMTCDYRMTTPYLGTGTCSLSNGAQYQVHIGG